MKFVQEHTIANKKLMSQGPDIQKKRQADYMRMAGDPVAAREIRRARR